jgi:hypothetical protein
MEGSGRTSPKMFMPGMGTVTMTKFDATVVASAAVSRAKLRCMIMLFSYDGLNWRL